MEQSAAVVHQMPMQKREKNSCQVEWCRAEMLNFIRGLDCHILVASPINDTVISIAVLHAMLHSMIRYTKTYAHNRIIKMRYYICLPIFLSPKDHLRVTSIMSAHQHLKRKKIESNAEDDSMNQNPPVKAICRSPKNYL